MRGSVLAMAVVCVAGPILQAQATLPYLSELQQNYTSVKNNLTRLADRMPEADYGFKPTPDIRAFSDAVAHVAEYQTRSCGLVTGETQHIDPAKLKTKAALIAAVKESFVVCDRAFAELTDATARQMVRLGQSTRERSKLALLAGMIAHSNEQYGYMSVYLRLKGIVPPSSEGQ